MRDHHTPSPSCSTTKIAWYDATRLKEYLPRRQGRDVRHTSNSSRLPIEIVILIVAQLIDYRSNQTHASDGGFFSSLDEPSRSVLERDLPAQKLLLNLLRVDRAWSGVVYPLLYSRPIILSMNNLRAFSRRIQDRPDLVRYLKELILLDTTERENKLKLFYDYAYNHNDMGKDGTRDDLRILLDSLPGGALSVVFVTALQSLLWVQVGPGLISDSGNEDPSVRLAYVHSLTLHGYAAHLLYTPFSFASKSLHITALPNLTTLNLDSMGFSTLLWPSMPALGSLRISRCNFVTISLPTPSEAPQLHTLSVHSIDTTSNNTIFMESFVSLIWPHAPSLCSLTLFAEAYQILLLNPKWHQEFQFLQYMALFHDAYHSRSRVSWTTGAWSSAGMPPMLRCLRIQGGYNALFDVTAVLDPKEAGNSLSPSSLCGGLGEWADIRLSGPETFWKTVPEHHIFEAKLACEAHGVVWTTKAGTFGECLSCDRMGIRG